MARQWSWSYTIKIVFTCPLCDEKHELESDTLEVDWSGCDCCDDERYVEVTCPKTNKKVEVTL